VSRRLIALIVGALAVGLIAGCGGGGNNNGSGISTNSLTKTEFIEQVNAICVKHHNQIVAEFEALTAKAGAPKGSERAKAFAVFAETVLLPSIKSESEEFRALGAPTGSEDEVEAIGASFEKGVKEADQIAKTGKRPSGLAEANRLAGEFGLNKDCMVA
jgi:hypothetical protein